MRRFWQRLCGWLTGHHYEFLTPTHNRVCALCGGHDCQGPALGDGTHGPGHSTF
jgi:hypothetical protein